MLCLSGIQICSTLEFTRDVSQPVQVFRRVLSCYDTTDLLSNNTRPHHLRKHPHTTTDLATSQNPRIIDLRFPELAGTAIHHTLFLYSVVTEANVTSLPAGAVTYYALGLQWRNRLAHGTYTTVL